MGGAVVAQRGRGHRSPRAPQVKVSAVTAERRGRSGVEGQCPLLGATVGVDAERALAVSAVEGRTRPVKDGGFRRRGFDRSPGARHFAGEGR